MHPRVLSDEGWATVKRLANGGILDGWILGGGTGLALRFGHRFSEDLVLFRSESFDPDRLAVAMSSIGDVSVQTRDENTLHAVLDGLRVSFRRAEPPLLFPGSEYRGLAVADPRDIAVMKVVAIGERGSRKDFVDLYFYLRGGATLDGVLRLLERRFAGLDYNEYHLLKSLTCFEDAESEPMPNMIRDVEWAEIRDALESEVLRLS
ncbi:MAG: nucleotidyl transferase AbiEii/AbiGii toxin family protein [Gemmatimonadota bacterium]